MDEKQAKALQRSTRKFHRADEALRNPEPGADVVESAQVYLKARKAHQKNIEKAESA